MTTQQDAMPVIFGLTGGIASGKSTVTRMLRSLGAHVIDADVIAREVVAPSSEGLQAIVDVFGEAMLREDGALDREALGELIFSTPEARKTLDGITHPRIAKRMMKLARAAKHSGYDWVIYDAALLVENRIHKMFAALIVVAVSPEVQLERLMARDASAREDALARIAAQLPLSQKIAVADHVIDNNGTLAQTRQQVEALFERLDAAAMQEQGQ